MVIDSSIRFSEPRLAAFCAQREITELALFGSAARGELSPDSDVDLMVTFAENAAWDLYDFAAMQEELSDIFGRRVDLVEKGTILNPYRRRTIERDLTPLYAA